MTKPELLEILGECARNGDGEAAHADADKALLEFIGDEFGLEAWITNGNEGIISLELK